MIIFGLALLGLIAGSFVDALVWRVWQQEAGQSKNEPNLSMLRGRSMCPNCRHVLAARDLVPLFSWLSLRGRCRYCKTEISPQSPLVEALLAIVFAGSYLLWPGDLVLAGQQLLLAAWLVCAVGLTALIIFDLRWMMLPNKIIYPTFFVAAAGRIAFIAGFDSAKSHSLINWGLSILVASGIFWLIFTVSSGRWIGYGDVRLGLITGTLLATPSKSLLMIIISAFAGTLIMLPAVLFRHNSLRSRIPYGPFLIAATAIVIIYGQSILDWYGRLLVS